MTQPSRWQRLQPGNRHCDSDSDCQWLGASSAKCVMHVSAYTSYKILACIFCIYVHISCISLAYFRRTELIWGLAYFLHISCIFFTYFLIFLHISQLHICAYYLDIWAYNCFLMHISCILHVYVCIFAYLLHISCIFCLKYSRLIPLTITQIPGLSILTRIKEPCLFCCSLCSQAMWSLSHSPFSFYLYHCKSRNKHHSLNLT
jgi:hypothetical protein